MNKLVLLVCVVVMSFLPTAVRADESCAMMSGICRDVCAAGEQAEAGAFGDCGEKQDCCVRGTTAAAGCCVTSSSPSLFGPGNCSAPAGGKCTAGSASPLPCGKLAACGGKP